MSLIVDEHRTYLSDPVRLEAFERAILARVRPGDIVVDIGTGTGLLALFACRAGARRVYAIETSGMIDVARAIADANGLADRIIFINRHSTEAVLPEQADVLTADLIGQMGFEAGLFTVYRDAARFMKPSGHMIPGRIVLAAAPVSALGVFEEVRFWETRRAGFDMTPAMRWTVNTGYPRRLERDALLSEEAVRCECDPRLEHAQLRLRGEVVLDRGGTMHGIVGWFDAELAPDVRLTNSPRAPERLARRNLFLPLERPMLVTAGTRVDIDVRIRPYDMVVSWSVAIHTPTGLHRERHSTLNGMLLSREDVGAHDPAWHPTLTPRGLARRTVLELCDGQLALEDIEREVFQRHRPLFVDMRQVQVFVAEVVTAYAQRHP